MKTTLVQYYLLLCYLIKTDTKIIFLSIGFGNTLRNKVIVKKFECLFWFHNRAVVFMLKWQIKQGAQVSYACLSKQRGKVKLL